MLFRSDLLAIDRVKQIFGADAANVQPHCGASANEAVMLAFLKPGDTIMGMSLAEGGHLTHGMPLNMSGKWFNVVSYGLNDKEEIDYDAMERKAHEHMPKLIIAGASAYSLRIDFERFAKVAKDVGAIFMVDIAHYAGLVAAGVYPNPVPHADIVTSTTHKSLRGLARLSLETGSQPEFAPARQLYASAGFAECGPFAGYVEDPHSVFMTRSLR